MFWNNKNNIVQKQCFLHTDVGLDKLLVIWVNVLGVGYVTLADRWR